MDAFFVKNTSHIQTLIVSHASAAVSIVSVQMFSSYSCRSYIMPQEQYQLWTLRYQESMKALRLHSS